MKIELDRLELTLLLTALSVISECAKIDGNAARQLNACAAQSKNRSRTEVISEMREIDFRMLHIMLEYDCRNCAYFTPCGMLGGCGCYILVQCLQALEY